MSVFQLSHTRGHYSKLVDSVSVYSFICLCRPTSLSGLHAEKNMNEVLWTQHNFLRLLVKVNRKERKQKYITILYKEESSRSVESAEK